MKTAVTICQVPEAAGGPFVFHTPLAEAFASAAEAGFDAVELFLPAPDTVPTEEIADLTERCGLQVAAVGTGAGMIRHGLSLTDPSAETRAAALEFILAMIAFGGRLGAPAILGSMQGRRPADLSPQAADDLLAAGIRDCAQRAEEFGVPFIYEPLNRYETNLINRLDDAAGFLDDRELKNVVLLADLFHMNIEEADPAAALRSAARHIGHVHYADSNRRAIGFGHTNPEPIVRALAETGYGGYLSAEILPLPDAETAARQTMASIRSHIS
jgi:sugar phosphate isomerase/epimerase